MAQKINTEIQNVENKLFPYKYLQCASADED